MTFLTEVETVFYPDQVNHRLRFGHPVADEDIDRRRAILRFRPGQVFGFVWWEANAFGTQAWAFAVCEAVEPPADAYGLPNVRPGAAVHLYAAGRSQGRHGSSRQVKRTVGPVERALALIDRLEADGFDPALVAPAYYRAAASRLALRRPVRPLGRDEYARGHRLRRKHDADIDPCLAR
ncbi:MAG: DUF2840 domain-containing protein [Rhodospirillales bacterium]|jgi:hypothetical protein|nr:DUF2840 domain-containing protein [Rhodospirillales bacterium]